MPRLQIGQAVAGVDRRADDDGRDDEDGCRASHDVQRRRRTADCDSCAQLPVAVMRAVYPAASQ